MNPIRRTVISLSLLLLLCAPVLAEQPDYYLAAAVGGNALMNAKSSDDRGNFGLEFNPALQWSAACGWNLKHGNPFGEGHIELEYSHRSNPLDQVKFTEGRFKGSGDVTSESLLVIFIGVSRDNSRWSPYLGAGIGVALVKASDLRVNGQLLGSGSDMVLAYQLAAGYEIALTRTLSLDLGYRWFSTTRPGFTETGNDKFMMDYINHSVLLGLKTGF